MWNNEEIRRLLDTHSKQEITRRVNEYIKVMGPRHDDKLAKDIKSWPHFLLAFYLAENCKTEGDPKLGERLIEYYLNNTPEVKRVLPFLHRPQSIVGLNSTDLVTLQQLYCGLELSILHKYEELIDLLYTRYNFDLNFVIPREYQYYTEGDDPDLEGVNAPIFLRVLLKEDNMRILLKPKYKLNINTEINYGIYKGVTKLFLLAKRPNTPISYLQFLIDHGADPYHPVIVDHPEEGILHANIYKLLEVTEQMRPQFEKLKQCLLNKRPVVEEGYSSEHSSGSGSNTPYTANSPNRSPTGTPPPKPSVMVRHSPPDSPVHSLNDSPPGSPIQMSGSSSGGSTGSSPERLAVQPAVYGQFTIPPGDGALDEEFHTALCNKRLDLAKAIYDTGRVKLTSSYRHDNKQKNVLQIVLTDARYKDLRQHMLNHPEYPADINSLNSEGQTALHLRMFVGTNLKGLPNRDTVTGIIQLYADKKPKINTQDRDGNTPLHIVAACGGTESHNAVDELLKRGADATIRNKAGLTAEGYCKEQCPDEEVKKNVLAVFRANCPQLTIPLGDGALDDDFHTALCNKRFDIAKALYDTGRVRCNTFYIHDKKPKNVLQIIMTDATYYKELHQYVLYHPKYPADINNVNSAQQTVLHIKMQSDYELKTIPGRNGVLAIMEKHADKKPNVDATDNIGNTPLHYASASGSTKSHEAVDELLKRGANANIRNREGLTAEAYCRKYCSDEEAKANVLAVFRANCPQQQPAVASPSSRSVSPIIYTGGNKSVIFPSQNAATGVNSASVSSPTIPIQREQTKSVGAPLFVSSPQASVELPKRAKKDESTDKSDKKSLGNRVKNLFHLN